MHAEIFSIALVLAQVRHLEPVDHVVVPVSDSTPGVIREPRPVDAEEQRIERMMTSDPRAQLRRRSRETKFPSSTVRSKAGFPVTVGMNPPRSTQAIRPGASSAARLLFDFVRVQLGGVEQPAEEGFEVSFAGFHANRIPFTSLPVAFTAMGA